jgi:hypothetical protein
MTTTRGVRIISTLLVVACVSSACSNLPRNAPALLLHAETQDDAVIVRVDGEVFTTYRFAPSQKYPYLFPVNGPRSGRSITTESSDPYPHHHSLFIACDRVNGANFWQEDNARGQIVSQGPTIEEQGGGRVVISDRCDWRVPGQEAVLQDERRITIQAPGPDLRWIDCEFTLVALAPVEILKTNHSLFAARVVPELSVGSGGTLVNAEGKTTEKGTWGVASAWCDASGERQGVAEGIAILQHPANRWYPAPWFTRDYGFLSPTPMFWPENGESTQLAQGERLTLRYRVVVHAGNAETAHITQLAEDYANETGGWRPLFDGETLDGWVQRNGQAKYYVEDGAIVGATVPDTPNSFLCTDRDYADFILELDFLVDEGLNSGIQIRSLSLPEYHDGRVHGYQVEIDPSARAWTAGIYDESRGGWLADLKENEPARKAFRQGEWNHVRIHAEGDSLRTWLNGAPAADLTDSTTASGFIGLQVHSTKHPDPLKVRWRDIRILELNTDAPEATR